MYVSTGHEPKSDHLKVRPGTSETDGWDYTIEIGYGTRIHLSRSELFSLTNQSLRLIADAWADGVGDEE